MRPSPLPASESIKQRLARGDTILALTLVVPSAETAAQAAALGFDVLWVEMEHSPITLESLRGIVLATRSQPAVVFARVPVTERWTAKRVLDQGVAGVVFPFVGSGSEAQRAARACRYPPIGDRGSGAGLACVTWPLPGDYYASADENVVAVAMIEDRAGLDAADDIAATPGIDVIFIGTSDLAFALGARGDDSAPVVQDAIARIAEAARRHGKPLGRPAPTPADVQRGRKQGFQFFQTVTELGLMKRGAVDFFAPTSVEIGERTTAPLY
ncbi:MAG TPA: aldolase/citrate lyase family protein [Opitutaceae bacterium]|nr:aldolase/citrate lyase family protein [Opitutaceae bacterium]